MAYEETFNIDNNNNAAAADRDRDRDSDSDSLAYNNMSSFDRCLSYLLGYLIYYLFDDMNGTIRERVVAHSDFYFGRNNQTLQRER